MKKLTNFIFRKKSLANSLELKHQNKNIQKTTTFTINLILENLKITNLNNEKNCLKTKCDLIFY